MGDRKNIKQIFKIKKGRKVNSALQKKSSNSARYIQIGDLRNDSHIQFTEDTHLVKVNNKDVVIAWDGSNAGTVGFGLEGIIGSTLARLRIHNQFLDKYDPSYLGYFLQSKFKYLRDRTIGATIPHIDKNILEQIEVPQESLTMQRHLVTALNKAKTLIHKRETSIRLLDDLLQSVFLSWFGLNNPDFSIWEEKEIQRLAKPENGSMRTGPFGGSLTHDQFKVEGDVAVLGIDNAVDNMFQWKKKRFITTEKYQELKSYTVHLQDVIITLMGTIGKAAVIPEDIPLSINTKHLACITLDKTQCNPYYLAYSIYSNPYIAFQLKARSRGAVMAGLNLGIIRMLKLKKAPIDLQDKFGKTFQIIEERKKHLLTSLSEFENLFQSILQRAFHGDLTLDTDLQLDGLLESRNFLAIDEDATLVQTLVDRFNTLKSEDLEKQEESESFRFETEAQYNRAKEALFHLLKAGSVTQHIIEGQDKSIIIRLKTV